MSDTDSPHTPADGTIASSADGALKVSMPFAQRAARISCYAALAVYLLGYLSTRSPLLWAIFLAVDLMALVLGIVGIIGGIKCGATATIRMGTLGALLSAIPLAVLVWSAI